MFKVIVTDNFARDYNGGKSEQLASDNIKDERDAEVIATALNEKWNRNGSGDYYAKVVPQDYELYVFEGY